MSVQSFWIAATVVALLQFARVRDIRIVPLLALFAFQAVAHHQTDWIAARPWHLAAGFAGLASLAILRKAP